MRLLLNFCDLAEHGLPSLWLAETGSRSFLSGRHAEAQVGDYDFELDEDEGPGFSAFVNWVEGRFLYACPKSLRFVFYPDDEGGRLAKKPKVEEVTISPNSLFIGHGYIENAGGEWQGEVLPTVLMHLTPKEVQLKETIVFEYCNSLTKAPKSKTEVHVEGSPVVVDRNMTNASCEDDGDMPSVVITNND